MHGSVIGRTRSAIIGLLLLLATWRSNDNCHGLQYQPVEVYANGDDCALILNGPGRTNAFDYTYNLLRGSFPPSAGSQTCITYDAVNRAYLEARKRINVAQPKSKMWRPEDLATVGELLLDISTNLAQTYGLTFEEIEKSLPLIDTSKTLIRDVCPAFLSNVECRAGKYRRNDGLCTNLQNPTWGSSLSPFQRLMSPRFADGLSAPRISITGGDLPLSRVVSRTMHPDEGYHDHAGTVMVIAWGQFMDHDYTLTATPLDPLNRNDPEECCHRPPHLKNPYCNEILIPEDDYFYKLFNVKCQDFVRAFPAVRPGCRLGPRIPFNLLTGVLDGNTVYGITEAFARKLRSGYGGLLRMNPVFSEYGLKDLLPLKLDIPDEGCTRLNRSMYCFEAGEIRVNEQLVLTCMHTLMAREHNRIAKTLIQVNPHWDDETLYQETRRIVIAEIQHITYNEFLPILLGKDVMEKFGLLLEKNTYWDGYDESVNPSVIEAFASAAFRFGHSLLPTAVERWSKAHKFIASKRLSDLIRRPFDLYRAGVFDEYIMGLMNQVAQAMDDSITQEVTNHLFKKAGAKFGMDLVSFNMQRGREFGIPSYMEFRKFCGLPWVDNFDDLHGSMPNETIKRYSSIFEHPADVDLWSGGVSERPLPGSMLGPTFACVIATQFSYSRRGDRFWYELPNQPSSFTLDQLNEIRKVKLAKVICDNTDLIDTIQIYPMVLPDHEINPRVPCRSGVLPSMDLSKWAEFPTTNHAQYNSQQSASNVKKIESVYLERSPAKRIKNPERKRENFNKNSEFDLATSSITHRKIEKHYPGESNTFDSKKNSKVVRESVKNANENPTEERQIVDIFATLDNRRKGTMVERVKRSSDKNSDYVGAGERVPRSERLYRHPNLSYEEQQQRVNDALYTGASRNFKNRLNNRLIPDVQSSSKSKVEVDIPSNESTRKHYVPLLPNCNDSTNSDERGASKPAQRGIKAAKSSGKSQKPKSVGNGKNLAKETSQNDEDDARRLAQQRKRNKGYINIRDLQKNPENATDIPEYDPNKIPYVDVPDYSDIREQSLDEEDRQATKSGLKEKQDAFADPEESSHLKESSKSLNADERKENGEEKPSKSSKQSTAAQKTPLSTNLKKLEPDAFANSDESIDSSEENEENGSSKASKGSAATRTNGDSSNAKAREMDASKGFPNAAGFSSGYEIEGSSEELPDGSRRSLNSRSGLNDFTFGKRGSTKSTATGESREENLGSRSGPVIFDINEYRKPFDLDEFLKDDPIMKKLTPLEKETPAKYGRNGKRVSSDFDESESVGAFGEPSRGDSTARGDAFDVPPKTHQSNDFTDAFADADRNGGQGESKRNAKKSGNRERLDDEDGDDESVSKRSELPSPRENEEEFPSKRFADDAVRNLQSRETIEEEFPSKRFADDAVRNLQSRETIEEDRERTEAYDALPAILSKKTHGSRPDEDAGGRIAAIDEPDSEYKNFWSLEYKSPGKRVDMLAQERRK